MSSGRGQAVHGRGSGESNQGARDLSDGAVAALIQPPQTSTRAWLWAVAARELRTPLQLARTLMMEQAYATVGQAIARLVSATEEDVDQATNQAVLQSVLQQRPVILGFALATFARRLREGERETTNGGMRREGGSTTALEQIRPKVVFMYRPRFLG